jgi:hypothetical protein
MEGLGLAASSGFLPVVGPGWAVGGFSLPPLFPWRVCPAFA